MRVTDWYQGPLSFHWLHTRAIWISWVEDLLTLGAPVILQHGLRRWRMSLGRGQV